MQKFIVNSAKAGPSHSKPSQSRFAKPSANKDHKDKKTFDSSPRFSQKKSTSRTDQPKANIRPLSHPKPIQNKPAEKTPAVETPMTATFAEMELSPLLKKAITELKYVTPTPIQGKTIPLALQGKDIMGCAQTGTGKTAAFLIPIINQMLADLNTSALVLVPTRELAVQIQEVLKGLTSQTKHINHAVLIGGMSMQPQLRALQKKPRFIIATPGRMIDHLNRRSVALTKCAFLVLDEADRMLDMGFIPQLTEIFRTLPKARQTLLFTATLPPKIVEISKNYMKHPITVSVGATSTPVDKINQTSVETTQKLKNDVVVDELNARKGSIIIFARTQRRADRLHKHLDSFGFKVGVIHGGKSQGQRTRALDGFRNSDTRILVATDVASRGLDIPHVAHVINYDLPEVAEDYVHRIGRTARAGKTGDAVAMIIPEEKHLWRDIQKLIQKK